MASNISASETSSISPSTITILSNVPAIIMSISTPFNSSKVGLTIKLPSFLAILTSETGPLNGISETASAAEAAKHASASGIFSLSEDINCNIT